MEQLNETEIRILQAIEDGGVLRGNMVRRRAEIKDPGEMVGAIKHLLDLNLIAASGNTSDGKSVMSAYFSPVPATRGLARQAVKGKL